MSGFMLITVSSLSATVGSMSNLSATVSVAVRFRCMDATSIDDWLEFFTGTVGSKVSSSLKQRRGQLILRIRVINQKEIEMLFSEWQTLSLWQPMQKSFILVFARILPNNLIHFWQPMLLLEFLTDKWFYLANTGFCQTLHSYTSAEITAWNFNLK